MSLKDSQSERIFTESGKILRFSGILKEGILTADDRVEGGDRSFLQEEAVTARVDPRDWISHNDLLGYLNQL